jgi:hypothetical protein
LIFLAFGFINVPMFRHILWLFFVWVAGSNSLVASESCGKIIAIIGWGSLVWAKSTPSSNGGELLLRSEWHRDGPKFPLEYARISKGNRLTLIIWQSAPLQTTLWAESAFENLTQAHANLAAREGGNPNNIHYVSSGGDFDPNISKPVLTEVHAWLQSRPKIAHVLWGGGLASNFEEKSGMPFSSENVVSWLRANANPLAEEYIRKTPKQIQPPSRSQIESDLGWVSR